MRSLRRVIVGVLVSIGLCASVLGATFRVGPDERYAKISEVAFMLSPGDVVEVTGDISDNATLTRSGAEGSPIVIRGVARVAGGRIVRPRIMFSDISAAAITCAGNWITVDGLELAGPLGVKDHKATGIAQNCSNMTIRNCYFHHLNFKAIVGSGSSGSITIEFCEFDSIGSDPLSGKEVDICSWIPGAIVRVEHCYFHDALYESLLKTHATRNIIRYNWFEGCYGPALKVTDRIGGLTPDRPMGVYPMHSDIVGNVFIQGSSPGLRYELIQTGGNGPPESGTEGDFNVAHNLFVMDVIGHGDNATVFDLVQGNVDHVKMYNNVFLQMGGPKCLVYLRDLTWDTPETRAFIKRRGSPDPIVEGSNNWIFERSAGIPEAFKNTLRGLNPKFVDLLNGDYRPRKDSPLAGAGMWPLPKGRIVDLVPEYEPQRGIPADLKPRPRRKVTPPSIGPFEVPEH